MRAVEVATFAAPPLVVFAFSLALYPPFQPLKDAIVMLLGGVLFGIALAAGRLRRMPRTWAMLVGLYCVTTLVSWAVSYRGDMGRNATVSMIAAPLLACAAVVAIRRRMLLIEAIAATGALEAIVVLAQWRASFDPYEIFYRARTVVAYLSRTPQLRPMGTVGSPDVAALVIAASFPAVLTLIGDRERSRRSRGFWFFLAVVELAAIAGTACRASLVGALAGGLVVVVSRWTQLRARTIIAVLAIVCLAGAAFVAARVANRRNRLDLAMATASRTFAWRVSLADWPGGPLLGSGPGTFRFIYWYQEGVWLRQHDMQDIRYAGGNADVQNDFLQARLEAGWLGLAALIALLAWWTRVAIAGARSDDAEQRTISITALGGVLAMLTVAMVESCFQRPETRLLIWLWMAAPLTFLVSRRDGDSRFAGVRWLAAVGLIAVFSWTAGRIVLSRYWTEQGLRVEFAGRFAEAVGVNRHAIDLDPENLDAQYHLSRALWRTGDLLSAVRTLDDEIQSDCDPRVYEMRIRILYHAGLLSEALRRANEGERIFPWAGEMQGWLDVLKSRMMTGVPPPLPPPPRPRP